MAKIEEILAELAEKSAAAANEINRTVASTEMSASQKLLEVAKSEGSLQAAIANAAKQIKAQQRERVEKARTLLHTILAHSCKDTYCPIKKLKKDALEALNAIKELEATDD